MKRKKTPRGFARIQAAMLRNEAYWLTQVVLRHAIGDRFFDSSFAPSSQNNALARLEGKLLIRRNRRGFHVPTREGVRVLRVAIVNLPEPLSLEGE
jgi:hypothetical protein